MNVTFDYYRNLEDVQFYLCNPDMAEISAIVATNRSVTLRFNDLSEGAFEAPKYYTDSSGNKIEFPYYARIETKRLIKMDKIGWFQITQAVEIEDGYNTYKRVTLESHQTILKDKGIYCEERVYKFYDPEDPTDANYDASDVGQLPSIVGQLYQQLGIQIHIGSVDTRPAGGENDWTIVSIPSGLYYDADDDENVCRTMKDAEVKYGYDFIVNDVSDAFEVIFDFDILNHTISVKTVEDVTEKTNIYLSFDNLVKTLEVTEKAEDIVTVLNCNGQDVNIQTVNPTGTNYIVDFSYYMDEENYHWMSAALIAKLKQWESAVNAQKEPYKALVRELMGLYKENTELVSRVNEMSLRISDTEAARDQYITDMEGTASMTFACGTVEVGGVSGDPNSKFYSTPFDQNATATVYKNAPAWAGGAFTFSGDSVTKSYKAAYLDGYYYFSCSTGDRSYGKLNGRAVVDPDSVTAEYEVSDFTENTVYSDVSYWLNLYAQQYDSLKESISASEEEIKSVNDEMTAISSQLNILQYFSSAPDLYRELRYYWIEGDYENENIAVLESTTLDEELSLAEELMEAGEKELSRVCQPRFSFVLTSVNFLQLFEFQEYSNELQLGKVITIEKSENLWYYPALTAIAFNLDNHEEFELTFSNAYKLSDWGFTYADLVTSAADTSRVVSSNWSELTSYSKDKQDIEDLLYNPLDKTLRMAQSNMVNQDFVIDTTGILGRKRIDDGGKVFEDEQIRIINNVILFTDDGWQHAKTALGKIIYTDEDGDHTAYGLLAEVIVGSLMMSNTLKIINEENSILLDEGGITIKNQDGEAVFYAKTNGDVSIKGDIYATSLTLGSGVNIPSDSVGGLDDALGDLNDKIDSTNSELTNKINQSISNLEGDIGDVSADVDQINGKVTEVTGDVTTINGILDGMKEYLDDYVVGWIDPNTGDLGQLPDGAIDEETGKLIGGQNITAFFVSKDGLLQASNAIIWGEIYASGGTIGGIRIRDNAIESVNGVFELTEDGKLVCTNAEITGDIVANSLTLGSGVMIPTENIDGLDDALELYIQKDGTVGSTPSDGATGFVVSSDGLLQASNAVIYGTIYASAGIIGGLQISGNGDGSTISTLDGTFYISTEGGVSEVTSTTLYCDVLRGRNSENYIDMSFTDGNTTGTARVSITNIANSMPYCTISYSLGLYASYSSGIPVTAPRKMSFPMTITLNFVGGSRKYSVSNFIPEGYSSTNGSIVLQVTAPTSTASIVFSENGSSSMSVSLTDKDALSIAVSGMVIPRYNSTYDLGSSTRRWGAGYFDELFIGTDEVGLPAEDNGNISATVTNGSASGTYATARVFSLGNKAVGYLEYGHTVTQDMIVEFDVSSLFSSLLGAVVSPRAPSGDDLSFENYSGALSVRAGVSTLRVCCDSGTCEDGFCAMLFGRPN